MWDITTYSEKKIYINVYKKAVRSLNLSPLTALNDFFQDWQFGVQHFDGDIHTELSKIIVDRAIVGGAFHLTGKTGIASITIVAVNGKHVAGWRFCKRK